MYNVTIFGIDLVVDPVAFKLPIGQGWTIYWYGIIIALGFVLAIIYGYIRAPKMNIEVDRMLDVVLVATPCAILGARTYYVIFDPNGHIDSVAEFFGFGGSGISGLAIYGGIIGAVVSGLIAAKIRKVNILDLLDLASIGFLIGQGVGRWGNFFNQEAFGGPTGSNWWGMTSENVQAEFFISGYGKTALAHPCFLYESVWCILGAVVLHILSKKRKFSGETSLMYCVWYGFGRSIIETMRTDSLMLGNAKVSFLLSLIICLGALVSLIILNKKHKAVAAEVTYEGMFKDEMHLDTEEEDAEADEVKEKDFEEFENKAEAAAEDTEEA